MSAETTTAPGCGPLDGVETPRLMDLLADQNPPIESGPAGLDEEGPGTGREAEPPMAFDFVYAGFSFECAVQRAEGGRLELRSLLGSLPYTAQSPWGRAFLLRLLTRAARLPSGRLALAEDGNISLEASKPAPAVCSPVQVMAVVAALLLEFKPYTEALRNTLQPAR